jgi:hypothetical protein
MVHEQVDLGLGQFPMGRTRSAYLTRFETPLDRPRAFFVSPNAEEQSHAMADANVVPEKTIDSSWELGTLCI